jgi:hypothetical protein
MSTEPVSAAPIEGCRYWQTAWRFAFWGTVTQFVLITLYQICDVAWIDFLHHNPYRTHAEAIDMMVMAPLFALFSMVLFSEGWLAVAAVAAGLSRRRLNRIPVVLLIVLIPLCVGAYALQRTWIWPPDDPDDTMQWFLMVAVEAFAIIPALFVAWWRDRRAEHNPS